MISIGPCRRWMEIERGRLEWRLGGGAGMAVVETGRDEDGAYSVHIARPLPADSALGRLLVYLRMAMRLPRRLRRVSHERKH